MTTPKWRVFALQSDVYIWTGVVHADDFNDALLAAEAQRASDPDGAALTSALIYWTISKMSAEPNPRPYAFSRSNRRRHTHNFLRY